MAVSLLATAGLMAQGTGDQPAAPAGSTKSPPPPAPAKKQKKLTWRDENYESYMAQLALEKQSQQSLKSDGTSPVTASPAKAAPAAAPIQPSPVAAGAPSSGATASASLSMPPPALQPPKITKHEVFVSGDVMFGEGTVTLPVGYSLEKSMPVGVDVPKLALLADRSSIYYGGTVSYSYGQSWYLDLSYVHGSSSGNQNVNGQWLGDLPSSFTIDDSWYQAYIRYTFPSLRGKRFFAYLRGGASFVQSDSTMVSVTQDKEQYKLNVQSQDILGNLGLGLGYWLYRSPHLRLGLQVEGEGFYGVRSQTAKESLGGDIFDNNLTPSASIENTVYGGIGRATLRLEMPLGKSGLFKIYLDGGVQGRYTLIEYPDATGGSDELLWGPYAKLGIRYAF